MPDPRRPVGIATFAEEYPAHALAAVLRDAGIEAAVFGHGATPTGLIQDSSEWRLMVPALEAARAREIIVQAREEEQTAVTLSKCPGCQYSLSGLPDVESCPECGLVLAAARDGLKFRSLVVDDAPGVPSDRMWKVLWIALGVCGLIGIVALLIR